MFRRLCLTATPHSNTGGAQIFLGKAYMHVRHLFNTTPGCHTLFHTLKNCLRDPTLKEYPFTQFKETHGCQVSPRHTSGTCFLRLYYSIALKHTLKWESVVLMRLRIIHFSISPMNVITHVNFIIIGCVLQATLITSFASYARYLRPTYTSA